MQDCLQRLQHRPSNPVARVSEAYDDVMQGVAKPMTNTSTEAAPSIEQSQRDIQLPAQPDQQPAPEPSLQSSLMRM